MKISIFFDGPQMGGIGARNIDLANEFIRQGHEVTLLVISADGPRKDQIPRDAMVKEIGPVGIPGIIKFLIVFFRKTPPDIVIASNLMPGAVVALAKFLAMRKKIALGIINRVDFERSYKEKKHKSIKSRLLYLIAPFYIRNYAKVISLSHAARPGLAKYIKCKEEEVEVIYDPIRLGPDKPKERFENQLLNWWENGDVKILSVGRLDKLKNFGVTIRSLEMLMDLAPKLMIIGSGPELDNLKKLTKELKVDENIKFAGYIANPSVFFHRADIFISSSLSEAFPNTVAEAVCAGCQVVSTDCNYGPREILGDNEWGRLVPLNDPAAIESSVRALITNPVPVQALNSRAQCFNPETIAKLIIRALTGD